MAGSIAKLVVTLAANVAGFETDMKRATSGQKKRMKEMEQAASAAGKAIAVAATAAATALTAIVVSSAKTADEMQKLALRTGLSTEALSEYKYAAELSGLSMEQLTGGIRKMQRSISDADQGLATQARAFERLGISVNDLIKLSPDQQFETIAEALSQLESATLRSATAQEIFGRSGTELLSIMGNGAEGIQQLREEAQRFGVTISGEFAANAERFNDNFERMGALARGAGQQLTAGMLPALISLQEEFLGAADATDLFFRAGQKLGEILRVITAAFIIVKNAALGFGKVLLGIIDLLVGLAQRVLAPITGSIASLVDAFAALKAGDFAAAGKAIAEVGDNIGADLEASAERVKRAGGFILETVGNLDDGLAEANKMFTATAANLGKTTTKFKENAAAIEKASASVKTLDEAKKKLGARLKLLEGQWDDINATLDEVIAQQEKLAAETQAYEDALKGLLDELYPVEAAGRRLGESLAVLTRAHREGALSWDEYQDAVNRAVSGFEKAVAGMEQTRDEVDLLSVAIDEGVRIIERTFASLFEGLIDGSRDAFDVIEDGFKSLMGSLAQAASRKIVVQIEQAFGEGGGGFSDLDLTGKFGQDLVAAIGAIVGLGSADSLFGQIGSTLGNIFGEALFTKIGGSLFPQLLGALGSWAGPIGTALGAILGSVLGDLVGGMFERDLQFSLGGSRNARANDAQRIRTPLGEIFGISGQGGFGSLNDPSTIGGQLAEALTQFDTAIADFLEDFASDEQFAAIRSSLEGWIGTWGEGAEAADVIQSRFNVILSNFDGDIRAFVAGAEDFEEQIQRFGVALSADKLIRENPEIFAGRTTGELLNLVAAFQSGAETMEDAFGQFLVVFQRVASVRASLDSFAKSDLLADFTALNLDLSLAESLARVNSELMDAVANFDGSVESFEKIGILALAAREGELKLLSEIDAIQKGINSNLDKLKADILGINAPDATGEQLFNQAQNLIGQISANSTAQDVAGIQQQFDSLIRSIAPEDQAFMQNEIVAIIELFRARANEVLNTRRQETLDNAANMREMIDGLLTRVGDPLDIIANSLEGQNLPEVMEDGLDAINASVASIGPQVANAIAQGMSNITIQVSVDPGLVTQ